MISFSDFENGLSNVIISHSEISGGEFPSNGSAIVLGAHCNIDLNGMVFRNNSGGALLLERNATLHAKDCLFVSNDGPFGGAISSKDAAVDVVLVSCSFLNNSASNGGAIHLEVSI